MLEAGVYQVMQDEKLRTRVIRPSDFKSGALAAELAGLWARTARSLRWSLATADATAVSVRQFVRFVDDLGVDRSISLSGSGDRLGGLVASWHASLQLVGDRKKFNRLLALLSRARFEKVELQPSLDLLITRATQRQARDKNQPRSQPLDEFSNAERILQMRAATDSLRTAEERVARGGALYDREPALRRLVALAMKQRSYKVIRDELTGDRRLLAAVQEIVPLPMNNGPHASREVVVALASLIGPTPLEVLSVRILLQWATGVAPEQVRRCECSELTFGSQGVRWLTFKSRSQQGFDLEFSGTQPWQVGGLFRRAIALTSRFRTMSESNRLLLTYTVRADEYRALRIGHSAKKASFAEWLTAYSITCSSPHDLRRIRKSHTAVRAAVAPTTETMKQPDHSVSTFDKHYSSSATSLTRAGRVIVRAQDRLVDRVTEPAARVLGASSRKVADTADVDDATRELARDLTQQTAEERSLSASACSDPTNSPFGDAGRWCVAAPYACMFCPNAVIFDDHAPQLILMKNQLQRQRPSLAPLEYAEQCEPYVVAIDSYLNQMSRQTVEAALAATAESPQDFNPPLARRITL